MDMAPMPWWNLGLRLLAAVVLGAAVGWNRERADKPAGIKTHILVCLGAAVVMLTGINIYLHYPDAASGMDPSRMAAHVISGVGFLGAGTIIHAEGGLVRGLTTAASVWAVAAVGLACGMGFFLLAGIATVLLVFTLALVNRLLPATKVARDAKPKRGTK